MEMKSVELAPGVHWVGAIDWNLREYHGYTLPGTTYNAYLVGVRRPRSSTAHTTGLRKRCSGASGRSATRRR